MAEEAMEAGFKTIADIHDTPSSFVVVKSPSS